MDLLLKVCIALNDLTIHFVSVNAVLEEAYMKIDGEWCLLMVVSLYC